MTTPTLLGTRVRLRAVSPNDAQARQEWGWHHDIERNYGHECATRPMTPDEARAWFDDIQHQNSSTFWVIEAPDGMAGVAFLHSLSEPDRKARYAIGMFDPRFLGRGLGTEATQLVLQHAFGELGLHRVDLRVLAFNTSAIASYKRVGFVEEGRERDSCRLEGQWHDDVIMGVLEPEFRAAFTPPTERLSGSTDEPLEAKGPRQ
ncbi:GNAT family protein [Pedococcus sp.]|jgi:RimJ/RimL family protein N-acetyltransferase|uniref:GNAT family N-acetyltransferase n=1 Tax=Pedococcus sp. TaxID=2860345 RepID=UPI002E0F170C|nr:GNAT family protein [Pedococcus sp.]